MKTMQPKLLLEKILIRSKNAEGKWDSLSLLEIINLGRPEEVQTWILWKLCGYEDIKELSTEQLEILAQYIPKDRVAILKDNIEDTHA